MPNLFGPGADWRTMPATPNQIAVIRRNQLASEDDMATMNRGYASSLINTFMARSQPVKDDTPSEAQTKLVTDLANNLGDDPAEHLANLTRRTATIVINNLRLRAETENKLAEGFYMVEGDIYRVKISDRGRRYANRLVKLTEPEPASNGLRTHRFIHIPGAVNRIRNEHALTREQAIAFGQETSSCVRCGTQLNPEIKQRNGEPRWIGPICETKMGW